MIFINVKILKTHVANKATMGNEMQHFGSTNVTYYTTLKSQLDPLPFVMHDNSPQLPLLCTNIASNRDERYNTLKTPNIKVLVTKFSSKSYPQL
jgi:hypothetical protein